MIKVSDIPICSFSHVCVKEYNEILWSSDYDKCKIYFDGYYTDIPPLICECECPTMWAEGEEDYTLLVIFPENERGEKIYE